MTRRPLALAVLVSGLAAFSTAAPLYRIALRSGTEPVLAKDKPVARGSVVLFHRYPDGRLTSVPREDVAGFSAAEEGVVVPRSIRRRSIVGSADTAVALAPARPLMPGEVLVLGVTGAPGGAGTAGYSAGASPMPGSSSRDVAARSAVDAQVFPGDLPVPNGGTGAGTMGTAYGQSANGPRVLNQPGLNPTLSGAAQANPGAAAPLPQGGAQPINPNGFPATTTTGPQSGAQPIDPNGFPSAAQPGQTVNPQPAQNTNGQTPNAQPAPNTNGQVQPRSPNGGTSKQ